MRFDNSSLFVNTGRKPLSAMQKRKKNTRNNILAAIVVAIIIVLCTFVGLILHVWLSYDESEQPDNAQTTVSQSENAQSVKKQADDNIAAKPEKSEKGDTKTAKKTDNKSEKSKTAKKSDKKTTKKPAKNKYPTFGTASECTVAVDKAFSSLKGTYAYGIYNLNTGYQYINNTNKISDSTALESFLIEYCCAKIYTGEFDYYTDVSGYSGESLMDSLIKDGSIDAANRLIAHFTPEKLNAYMEAQGYSSTHFSNQIADGTNESFTTVSDVTALIKKLYDKSRIFPYSDLYGRMRQSRVNNKIRAVLPYETPVANISTAVQSNCFDAGIVFSPNGNYIFIALAKDYKDDGTMANTAIAEGAKAVYDDINK